MRTATLLFPLLCLLVVQPVRAQATQYTLEPDGTLRATRQPEPGSDEATIFQTRTLLAQERPAAAFAVIDLWIKRNDADEQGTSPWLSEAYLLRGDCRVAMRREFKALFDYEHLIRRFPATESFVTAIERELDIAQAYSDGLKRRVLGIRRGKTETISTELMIRAQERMPGSVLAERAAIMLGDHYFNERKMDLAGEAYDLYLLNFPRGLNRAKAMQRRIFANIAQFKGPRYDTSSILDAQSQIHSFMRQLPSDADRLGIDDALLIRLDESLAAQQLETASWYIKRGESASARYMLRRLLRDHPRAAASGEALTILQNRGWLLVDRGEDTQQ